MAINKLYFSGQGYIPEATSVPSTALVGMFASALSAVSLNGTYGFGIWDTSPLTISLLYPLRLAPNGFQAEIHIMASDLQMSSNSGKITGTIVQDGANAIVTANFDKAMPTTDSLYFKWSNGSGGTNVVASQVNVADNSIAFSNLPNETTPYIQSKPSLFSNFKIY